MATLPMLTFESTRAITQDQFERWALHQASLGDRNRYELVAGKVVMNPPAGYPHGRIEVAIAKILANYVDEHRLGIVFGSSQGFALPTGDTLEPDVSFIGTDRWSAARKPEEGAFLRVVPDLVVEIASRSTKAYDRKTKKSLYERAGVREYWIVDHHTRSIVQLVRKGRKLGSDRICKKQLSCEVVRGLVFDVTDVFPS